MFRKLNEKNVSVEEMNEILQHASNFTNIVVGTSYSKLGGKGTLTTHSYLVEREVNVEFTTMYGDRTFKPCTYFCRLDGEVNSNGGCLEAYRILRKYYKEPQVADYPELEAKMPKSIKGSYSYSAGPIIGYAAKYDRTRHPVWIYDINSAYSTQMMDKIPDLSTYKFYEIVKPGEVGFLLQEDLPLVPEGYQGDVVMKLIDSPYRKFALEYYARKKAGDRQAKIILNHSVGFLQRRNPFIRSYIIHKCNELIASLIDEHTCMWNTDAIYSVVPRSDLKIGTEIGQWKEEYIENFAQKGNNYQKGYEISYRHVAKSWFKKGFDILKDELPTKAQNIYELRGTTIVNRGSSNEI